MSYQTKSSSYTHIHQHNVACKKNPPTCFPFHSLLSSQIVLFTFLLEGVKLFWKQRSQAVISKKHKIGPNLLKLDSLQTTHTGTQRDIDCRHLPLSLYSIKLSSLFSLCVIKVIWIWMKMSLWKPQMKLGKQTVQTTIKEILHLFHANYNFNTSLETSFYISF